jgi:hypothetical protein
VVKLLFSAADPMREFGDSRGLSCENKCIGKSWIPRRGSLVQHEIRLRGIWEIFAGSWRILT